MFITTEDNALAARKAAMGFHSRNKIKSINEIAPHELKWSDLNAIEKDARKSSLAVMDRAGGSAEALTKVEPALDAFSDLLSEIRTEKDERAVAGDKGARSQSTPAAQMSKRPVPDAGDAINGVSDSRDVAYALAPEQRFKTWAQAKAVDADEYRGLNMGGYLRSMIVGGKTDIERRALSEGSDSAGGYTVPAPLSAELIDNLRAASVVTMAGARTVPLTSDSNSIAKLLTDPSPAWRLEAGAVAESDPTFGPVSLTPRSLAVQVKLSAELMEDSLNLGTELPRILAAAMAVELDRVALLGSGTAPEPRGVANTSGIGTTAVGAAMTNYAQLISARTGILTANAGPVSAIIMHPRDEGDVTGWTASDGQPLNAPRVIEEIPILTTTSIPIDGGAGTDESTIFAGNFAHMLVGIRSDIRVEVLKTSTYASNMQYTLLAHMRADIAVTQAGAFHTLTGVQG